MKNYIKLELLRGKIANSCQMDLSKVSPEPDWGSGSGLEQKVLQFPGME